MESLVTSWSRVLDLYAGSGALGIEALSRGAKWVDFVEHDTRCCAIIKENLERTGLADRAHVYCCSVAKALTFLEPSYDIILLDPPYSDPSLVSILEKLVASAAAGQDSTIVVEHSRRQPLGSAYGDFRLVQSRRHGDSCISIYHR